MTTQPEDFADEHSTLEDGAPEGTEQEGAREESADHAALLAQIDAEIEAEEQARPRAGARTAGVVMLGGALVAWIAALALLVDKMHLIANPGATLGCDISPFISCGSVMMTWQASAFGFPNMALGLGGFAIMGAYGALLAGKAAVPRWFHLAALGGMAFAFAFVHFLAISAIFVIGALCPWCMVVWAMTAPMFFVTLAHLGESGVLRLPAGIVRALRHWALWTLGWYLLVTAVIFLAFLPQWMAMLGV